MCDVKDRAVISLPCLVTSTTQDIYHSKILRPLFVCVFRCSDSARPETIRSCLLPCKKDCIVTPFSEWTACPSTCMPGSSSSDLL